MTDSRINKSIIRKITVSDLEGLIGIFLGIAEEGAYIIKAESKGKISEITLHYMQKEKGNE